MPVAAVSGVRAQASGPVSDGAASCAVSIVFSSATVTPNWWPRRRRWRWPSRGGPGGPDVVMLTSADPAICW